MKESKVVMKSKAKKKEKFLSKLYINHNTSWARYLFEVNKKNMDKPAIFYRGRLFSYRKMFSYAVQYAEVLQKMGVKKGMEIPMCLSHCPEEVFLMLAASFLGAKINVFSEDFDEDYIREIVEGTKSRVLFMTDDKYEKLKSSIDDAGIDKIVMFSLKDSYPIIHNWYRDLENKYYDGVNRVVKYKRNDERIMDILEFAEKSGFKRLGIEHESYINYYLKDLEQTSTLDDEFSVTYSSSSLDAKRPESVRHSIKSWIASGLAHDDKDVPKTKKMRTQVQMPSHMNTSLIREVSDTLSQGGCCALEFIYDEDFFPISLLINKPNKAYATTSYWLNAFFNYEYNPPFANVKRLPYLEEPVATEEMPSRGEEKFLNKMLRKYRAGANCFPIPGFKTTMSKVVGNAECGDIFFSAGNSLKDKESNRYDTYDMVDIAVLDSYGEHCAPTETGTLVVASPLLGENSPESADKNIIIDENGKSWHNFNRYGYLDKDGDIHICGSTRTPYMIKETILKDTKNIMSCEVVRLEDDTYVAHYELQPGIALTRKILYGLEMRLQGSIPLDIAERVVYRQRDAYKGWPLNSYGAKDLEELKKEGLENTKKMVRIPVMPPVITGGETDLSRTTMTLSGERYLKEQREHKRLQMKSQNQT